MIGWTMNGWVAESRSVSVSVAPTPSPTTEARRGAQTKNRWTDRRTADNFLVINKSWKTTTLISPTPPSLVSPPTPFLFRFTQPLITALPTLEREAPTLKKKSPKKVIFQINKIRRAAPRRAAEPLMQHMQYTICCRRAIKRPIERKTGLEKWTF